jgi:REP element-mobilizing transposase RayT
MGWNIRNRGEDLYHHVYAWGNNRHAIFKDPSHYRQYLSFLESRAREENIDVIAYALMEWHVHLFIYDRNNNIADFMMSLHGDYAQYFNRDCQQIGHVFGKRYNNKIVANTVYCGWLSRYIHRQAVEAGLTDDPASYPWTSYNCYLGSEPQGFVKYDIVLDDFNPKPDRIARYKDFVMGDDEGPVDWSHRIIRVRAPEYFIRYLSREFDIESSVLVNPRGRREKVLRHKAARSLIEKYGLNYHETAKILGITPGAISKFNGER